MLPNYLRELAGIDGEVVVAGMYNYVEVWSIEAGRACAKRLKTVAMLPWDDLGI